MTTETTPKNPNLEGWTSLESDIVSDYSSLDGSEQEVLRGERIKNAEEVLEKHLVFQNDNPRNKHVFNDILFRIAYNTATSSEATQCAQTLLQVAHELHIDDQLSEVAVGQFLGNLPNDLVDAALSSQIIDYAMTWNERVMSSGQSDVDRARRLRAFGQQLRSLTGSNESNKPRLTEQEMDDIFRVAVSAYEQAYELLDREESLSKRNEIEIWISEISRSAILWHDAMQTEYVAEIMPHILQEDDITAKVIYRTLRGYLMNAPLTQPRTGAFISTVIPRIKNKDVSVNALLRGGNTVGIRRDEFGIATFDVHELTGAVTPANLREGLNILRMMPTSSLHRFEDNRRDGIQIAGMFAMLKEAIHDQRPGVNDVLKAMIGYYEDHDVESFLRSIDGKCDYIFSKKSIDELLDLERYETTQPAGEVEYKEMSDESTIHIIRRLERNTRSVDDMPPELLDKQLAVQLRAVYEAKPGETKQMLTDATRFVNDRISSQIADKKVGIEPEFISALAWLENEQFKYLQGLKFEDQAGLARQGTFQQILLMHELTHNDEFDQEEFTDFTETIAHMDDLGAAGAIAKRVLEQVSALANTYITRGKREWADALWSGNVTHELMGMIDTREATTALGKKIRAERHGAQDAY